MSQRPILLINGRWTRLDEIISMNIRVAADPTIPPTANLTYVRKGRRRPHLVYQVTGCIETAHRRSGRQVISLLNQEVAAHE